jgi:hypothetical protein
MTYKPTRQPTRAPTRAPSRQPTIQPSRQPTLQPTIQNTSFPTDTPSGLPSSLPSSNPTSRPTKLDEVWGGGTKIFLPFIVTFCISYLIYLKFKQRYLRIRNQRAAILEEFNDNYDYDQLNVKKINPTRIIDIFSTSNNNNNNNNNINNNYNIMNESNNYEENVPMF